ncbi:hypothetical protein [Sphingomonas faeni]|uniref:hypothetical protein n=1 Tax=Sphingomonas faeni TaxID=185950 RepID=UPI00334A7CDD
MKILASVSLIMLLSGCAADAVRPTATRTLLLTQDLKTELSAFAARQNVELESRRLSIATLDENSSLSEYRARRHVMDWKSSGDVAALRLFEQASSNAVGTLPASVSTGVLLAPSPASGVTLDAKTYDDLITALKPLAAKRSGTDQVEFILSYGRAVSEQMRKNVAEAAKTETGTAKPAPVETED